MEYGLPISKDGPSKKKGWNRKLAKSTLSVPALSKENIYPQGPQYVSQNVLEHWPHPGMEKEHNPLSSDHLEIVLALNRTFTV